MNHSATRTLAAILATLAALFLAACSSDDSTSDAEPDVTPPTVLASFPDSGAVNVTRSGPYWIAFSESMNEESVDTAIAFSPGPVYYNTSWNGDTLVITPTELLGLSTGYTITVGAEAEDENGNLLGSDYVIGFTTTAIDDNTPPTVVSTSPADEAVAVPGTQTIEVVWSEPMDQTVDMQAAITMAPEPEDWWVEWDAVTMEIHHTAFPADQIVSVTIGTTMRDLAGNNLAVPYEFVFTTMSDDARPYLASASPANGQTGVSVGLSQVVLTFSEPMDPYSFDIANSDMDARFNQLVGEEPTWSTDYSVVTVPATSQLLSGCTYWVLFRNVTDAAGNIIDPSPTEYEFTTAGTQTLYPIDNGYLWNFIDPSHNVRTRAIEDYSVSTGEFNEVFRDESAVTQEVVRLRKSASDIFHLGRDEYQSGVYQFSMIWDDPLLYIRLPLENYLGDTWTFSTAATISPDMTMTLSGRIEIEANKVDLLSSELYGTFRGCYVHHLYADWIMYENGNPVDEGGTHQILYFAPGVGPVLRISNDSGGYTDTLRIYDWNL